MIQQEVLESGGSMQGGGGGQNTYSWGIPLLMDLVREKVHLQLEFVLNIYKKNVALSRALYLYTNLKR